MDLPHPCVEQAPNGVQDALVTTKDWPVEAACAVAYAGWQGKGLATIAEVEDFFAQICFGSDQALREPAACRWFLNWFDETPRDQMWRGLLAEIDLALAGWQPFGKSAAASPRDMVLTQHRGPDTAPNR
jgi:hypothetical protein